MSRPSDFAGTLLAQFASACAKEEVEPSHIDALCRRKDLLRAIPSLLEGKLILKVSQVGIDSVPSLAEMISAGKYDWVDEYITEANFPMPENFVLGSQSRLLSFSDVSLYEATTRIEMNGYRPATIRDLINLGVKNPEESDVYALGSPYRLGRGCFVPYLESRGKKRGLSLHQVGNGFGQGYRFLAVRN